MSQPMFESVFKKAEEVDKEMKKRMEKVSKLLEGMKDPKKMSVEEMIEGMQTMVDIKETMRKEKCDCSNCKDAVSSDTEKSLGDLLELIKKIESKLKN